LPILVFELILPLMKIRTRNISLSGELDSQIDRRVKSGRYGNASDVIRAGLRALEREERAEVYRRWLDISDRLPRDITTPEAEQRVVALVRASRARSEKATAKKVSK
jgi:antitoxin ParD1/3/4